MTDGAQLHGWSRRSPGSRRRMPTELFILTSYRSRCCRCGDGHELSRRELTGAGPAALPGPYWSCSERFMLYTIVVRRLPPAAAFGRVNRARGCELFFVDDADSDAELLSVGAARTQRPGPLGPVRPPRPVSLSTDPVISAAAATPANNLNLRHVTERLRERPANRRH